MLTAIDNITIVVAIIAIYVVIKFVSKQSTDMDAYYRANKSLPWSLAVGTIAASWYGGNGTIGTVGYVGSMGLAAYFIWSFGCHLSRFPLALWVAPRISVKINGTMDIIPSRSSQGVSPDSVCAGRGFTQSSGGKILRNVANAICNSPIILL